MCGLKDMHTTTSLTATDDVELHKTPFKDMLRRSEFIM